VLSIVLSALLAISSPMPQSQGTATWYGSTSGYKSFCFGGYKNTCTPYARGEKVWYAAVGSWRWGDKPYKIRVCRTGTARCVVVMVRDYCHGAWKALKKPWTRNSRLVDLSPAAFMELGNLSRGVLYVTAVQVDMSTPLGPTGRPTTGGR
jgi:rare lipoprotein A (peptidoglycan hydrolase)